ncbi:MAG: uroporphyrinogen decarboxylase [Alphaproteobacteria bacterium]|nr:uroporphyrinogen decarboxylase [Alphaproteobacteria bacterium]
MPSLFLRTLAGEASSPPPIWLMRQAGRYLPEYREIRAQAKGFLDLCYTPDLAVEVTMQPIRRYGFDAAILFSDILVVPDALGSDVDFVEGEGPKLSPIRNGAGVARLGKAKLHEHLAPVYETLRRLRRELPEDTALIGFAGAPWTVASYMVEGGGSKEFQEARLFARRDPEAFSELIDLVTSATIDYLRAQIDAGAEALQLFDSWAGVLPPAEFQRWCLRPMAAIVDAVKASHSEIPIIAFPRGAGVLYQHFVETVPVDGVSLDTTVPREWAAENLRKVCLQGNLDPIALLSGGDDMLNDARHLLNSLAGRPHIFNLGHGVLPPTDPDTVSRLVDFVRSYRPSSG